MAPTKYDYRKIEEILKDVMDWLGEESFSTLKVTELEQHVRNRQSTVSLPGSGDSLLPGMRVLSVAAKHVIVLIESQQP
jgi:hypothetical protein